MVKVCGTDSGCVLVIQLAVVPLAGVCPVLLMQHDSLCRESALFPCSRAVMSHLQLTKSRIAKKLLP
jgi:hypothetical protein